MKWILAWKQMKKSRLMTGFTIVELFLLFLLLITGSSIISYNTKDYREFADCLSSGGIYMEFKGGMGETDSAALEKKFKKTKVYACYGGDFSFAEDKDVYAIGYDKELIKRHRPELSEGVWLTDAPKDEKMLHVIVGGKLKNQKPGTILYGKDTKSGKEFEVKVIGVLNDHATIVGHPNGERVSSSDYNKMFTHLGEVKVTGSFVLFDKEEAERLKTEDGIDIHYGLWDVCLLQYQKNIRDEEAEYNREIVINELSNQKMAISEFEDLPNINKNSIRQMGFIVYTLIPVIVACFVMTLITAICSGAIMLRRQMYDYAVYYMSGMKWMDCAVVNLYVNLIETGIAFVLAAIVVRVFVVGRYYFSTQITFTLQEVGVCVVAEIFYLLLAMILPSLVIRKSSAIYILTKTRNA